MTDHTVRDFLLRVMGFAIRAYVVLAAAAFLWAMLGQALTGGLKTTTPPGPVPADVAALMFTWLAASIYCALSPRKGGDNG